MNRNIVGSCPVCSSKMIVTELECPNCHTKISGKFELGKFSWLTREQLE
ncbi:DUF2089 family protein, partial [Candidatus Bipolaricaulota bacterium]|nr:DUF2089 family protein [Candidatus Bipolaricaulota bacterium]